MPEQGTYQRPPPLPEAAGPGTDALDGSVTYGVEGPRAFVTPPRPAAERDRDMAAARDGCTRCAEVPAEVITAIVAALRAAKAGRAPL